MYIFYKTNCSFSRNPSYSYSTFSEYFVNNAHNGTGIEKKISASLEVLGKLTELLFSKGLITQEEIKKLFPWDIEEDILAISNDINYKPDIEFKY